jgi:predicted dehydrogenase
MKKRAIMVGCGVIAREWMNYLSTFDDFEMAALVEINREAAEKLMREYGFKAPVYADLKQAIDETGAQLVFDLTYVTVHKNIVIPALEAGCDVFGEKPMALTREDADAMLEAVKRTGRNYFILQNRRYSKGLNSLKDFIGKGYVGKVGFVTANQFVHADLSSIRDTLEFPMIEDNAVHAFDQVRYLLDADAVTCYCKSFSPPSNPYKGDGAGAFIFEMSNEAVFSYNCWLGAEGFKTSWESEWRVAGSEGAALWKSCQAPVCQTRVGEVRGFNSRYKEITAQDVYSGPEQHGGAIKEMLESLEKGMLSQTNCFDNIKSMAMVYAAVESAKTGLPAKVKN